MNAHLDAMAQAVDAGTLDEWCRRVDAAVDAGVDPFCAVVDADVAMREAMQASLDRD